MFAKKKHVWSTGQKWLKLKTSFVDPSFHYILWSNKFSELSIYDISSSKYLFLSFKLKKKGKLHNGLPNEHADEQGGGLQSGTLEFNVSYAASESTLKIGVQEVRDIKLGEGSELVSPYINVRLYRSPKQFFTFGGGSPTKDQVINNLDKEMKTKMQRPTGTLVYKEKFHVAIPPEALKYYTIRFLLCDMNKLSRHVVLGESSLVLRKTEISSKDEELKFSQELQPPIQVNCTDSEAYNSTYWAMTLGPTYRREVPYHWLAGFSSDWH